MNSYFIHYGYGVEYREYEKVQLRVMSDSYIGYIMNVSFPSVLAIL